MMLSFKCLGCFVAKKKFLLVFGIIYAMSVVVIVHHTSQIELEAQNVSVDRRKPEAMDKAKIIAKDMACRRLKAPMFLAPGKMPLTALHSFPGSGNTWVRILLSRLTGLNTGDIYKDASFSKTPGFTNRRDDTVVVVKTHHPFWDDFDGLDPSVPKGRYWQRSIIIVRHPLDTTVSAYNWFRMKGSHTKTAPLDKYINLLDGSPTKEWSKWAHDQIRNWRRCLRYWINVFKGHKLIVFYEDLISNLREELVNINTFLGLELNGTRLNCTVRANVQQKFHRNRKLNKHILYDTSMLTEAEIVLRDIRTLLMNNYTHNKPGFRLPSNYAVNLVRENFSVRPQSTT